MLPTTAPLRIPHAMLIRPLESPAILVEIQPLQPLPHPQPALQKPLLLPTKMGSKIPPASLPRGTRPRSPLEQDVQAAAGCSRAHGSSLHG